jgi:predicted amidohydrolase
MRGLKLYEGGFSMFRRKYTVALVQVDTQADKAENMRRISDFLDEAAAKGAALASLPEVMNRIGRPGEDEGETVPGYSTEILARKAKQHKMYIHGGSLFEKRPGEPRCFNTSVLIDTEGNIAAVYRKLHTFDVTLPDGTACEESAEVCPGSEIVTADTELGKFGFSICYDIRFPELFRRMALEGAQVFFTPANFTLPTGKDHWEPLLRARAIENGCYVVAAAQIGTKPQFAAYGNSLVADPWGTVIARAKEEPGVTCAEIDLDFQDKVRARIPSLRNRRPDIYGWPRPERS